MTTLVSKGKDVLPVCTAYPAWPSGFENCAARECHGAEAVHDAAGQPDRAGELVIDVDREVVTRGGRVADGLVLGDPVRELRVRVGVDLEAVVGFTSSPRGVRVSVLITSDVPFGRGRSATGVALETTSIPASSGRWSSMSCS